MPGAVNVDARIFRLNTYIESGKLIIFNSCKKLKEELTEYKFIAKAGMMNGWSNKPEDKNNHGINALERITMELPANPKYLIYGIYNKKGNDITKQQEAQKTDEQKMLDWMFSDNTDDEYDSGPYGADYD